MEASDLAGMRRSGAQAHAKGLGFFDCPFYTEPNATKPLDEWCECASAWQAGWLDADQGRDKAVQRFLNLPTRAW